MPYCQARLGNAKPTPHQAHSLPGGDNDQSRHLVKDLLGTWHIMHLGLFFPTTYSHFLEEETEGLRDLPNVLDPHLHLQTPNIWLLPQLPPRKSRGAGGGTTRLCSRTSTSSIGRCLTHLCELQFPSQTMGLGEPPRGRCEGKTEIMGAELSVCDVVSIDSRMAFIPPALPPSCLLLL